MKIDFNDILYAFSFALDCIEHEVVGVTTHHAKRVAYISVEMGRKMGMTEDRLIKLAACAILHDCALTQFLQEEGQLRQELPAVLEEKNMGVHCTFGEQNVQQMPFLADMQGAVLYHHERADGTGPFGKRAEQTPLAAQLIHFADQLDAHWDLSFGTEEKYQHIVRFVKESRDSLFASACVDVFLDWFTPECMANIYRERIDVFLRQCLPPGIQEYQREEIKSFAAVFASIIDYKSEFTRTHSIGIAQKAEVMGRYYGYNDDDATMLYFAGAVHDLGKLVVDRDILEKPDKLTEQEYKHIQNHAYYTYDILRRIGGLEQVTLWAALHHEKLDGSGYPFGRIAAEMGLPERMMACLDIYQALTERRPYKEGYGHQKAIEILLEMADKNLLDKRIVEDLDQVFQTESK